MAVTLEQELKERIFLHKTAVLRGFLIDEYVERNTGEGINIPEFLIREKADKYSDIVMEQALRNGTFEKMYQDAWQQIAERLPESFSSVYGIMNENERDSEED